MTVKELIEVLSQYEEGLEVQILEEDSLGREHAKPIKSISERYEFEGGVTLEVGLGVLNIHIAYKQ